MPKTYVWQQGDWTQRLRWDGERLLAPLANARRKQGVLLGKMASLGFELGLEARAEVLVDEAVTTAAIEGQALDPEAVRSSVARRLGLPTSGLPTASREADGLVQMLLDATQRYAEPLTEERLIRWQAALFPTGYSDLRRIVVGQWRQAPEPMQVVSGRMGQERVHYEAPPAARVPDEMMLFLTWWSSGRDPADGLLRAGVAHFWFVTVHPFEDGNGRIGRAIADMALAQDERTELRPYSLSSQIRSDQSSYYDALERAQSGAGELTQWLEWFLTCVERAVERAELQLDRVLAKARFWQRCAGANFTQRQRKVVNRLLDAGQGGFKGGLTTRKYIGMTRASRATAQREISDLVARGVLVKQPGGGRSTSYDLAWREIVL